VRMVWGRNFGVLRHQNIEEETIIPNRDVLRGSPKYNFKGAVVSASKK